MIRYALLIVALSGGLTIVTSRTAAPDVDEFSDLTQATPASPTIGGAITIPAGEAPSLVPEVPATPTAAPVTPIAQPTQPVPAAVKPTPPAAPVTPPVTVVQPAKPKPVVATTQVVKQPAKPTPKPAPHPAAQKAVVKPVVKKKEAAKKEPRKVKKEKTKKEEHHKEEHHRTLAEAVVAPAVTKEKEVQKRAAVRRPLPKPAGPGLIDFTFDNANLTEVIERYARKKGLNVILPQQAQAIKQKITFKPPQPLTIEEAEKFLYLFLDYAGYTVVPRDDFSFVIKSKDAPATLLPLYVFDATTQLAPQDLPANDGIIRVIYYLANLKIDDQPNNPVLLLLKEILSSPTNVFIDPLSNAVVITDKSRSIISALELLKELDATGSRHILVTLQLYNASAGYVADLLNSQILAVRGRPGIVDSKSAGMGTYFSTNIRVVADTRRNTIIIMGKESPVSRLKDFVREYMDAPAESGQSIFHQYDLKYLDAQSFAEVLSSVVRSTGLGDQRTVDRVGGARRFFEGVVIRAETYQAVESPQQMPAGGGGNEFEQGASSGGTVYRGGNRLLVAAQPSDWEQLKKLIDQLDIPQKQVILEVLIVDFQRSTIKAIQSQLRNPLRLDFLPGAGVQTAHITSNIVPSVDCGIVAAQAAVAKASAEAAKAATKKTAAAAAAEALAQAAQTGVASAAAQGNQLLNQAMSGGTTAANQVSAAVAQVAECPVNTTITGDLLRILSNGGTIIPADAGTFAVSVNDTANNGIFDLFTLLDSLGHIKILSHPYLIALDNTNAIVFNSDIRRAPADGSSSQGGAIQVNIDDIQAVLSVSLTPRISSIERLNLEIKVQIEAFTQTVGFTRNSRYVQTNVNMRGANDKQPQGEILVLGGLKQVNKVEQISETPILGRIPILGWLFRGAKQILQENELAIFIKPTIIDPRRRLLMNNYTRRKVLCETVPFEENILGNRKDPIVRFFFGDGRAEQTVIEDYMRENYIVPPPQIVAPPPPISQFDPLQPMEKIDEALMPIEEEEEEAGPVDYS